MSIHNGDNTVKSLNDIKVGDKVFISNTHLSRVTRLTPTQIVLTDGDKYRKSSGRLIGGGDWNIDSITYATTEQIEQHYTDIKKRKLAQAVSVTSWQSLTIDQLTKINDIIQE